MAWLPQFASLRHFWQRSGKLLRLALYLAALDSLFLLIQGGSKLLHGSADVSGWITYISLALAVIVLWAVVRWLRRRFMWRLRNQLIVTYTFIGIVPVVLLIVIGILCAYVVAMQFAGYIVTSDIRGVRRELASSNTALAQALAEQVRQGVAPPKAIESLSEARAAAGLSRQSVTVWVQKGSAKPQAYSIPENAPITSLPSRTDAMGFEGMVLEDNLVYLRAYRVERAGPYQLTIISSVALRSELLRMASGIGVVTLAELGTDHASEATPGSSETQSSAAGSASGSQSTVTQQRRRLHVLITVGVLPARQHIADQVVWFGAFMPLVNWETGDESTALLQVRTRPSLFQRALFASVGTQIATGLLQLLALIAIIFAVIELAALLIGIRLTRTITGSVAALYTATQHVNRGDLRHRIDIGSDDQLAALEGSFNSMSASLEKLLAEQKEMQRIESELAIAQEVQAQLFPGDAVELRTLEVHGICKPARTVSGDYYDFLPLGAERLGIALGDISGKGISAALLMATIHSAVRAYELDRPPSPEQRGAAAPTKSDTGVDYGGRIQSPSEVLGLLNRHLFRSTPPEKYATLFLGLWDGAAHTLTYSNAGHLPPRVVGGDGSERSLQRGGTVIGLFDAVEYESESVQLKPGDLLLAFSDGITEPENEFGEFGEERLLELVRANRHLDLSRISEIVVSAVLEWIGSSEQPDDITLVLFRAR